jgi:uncharacterized protein YcfL
MLTGLRRSSVALLTLATLALVGCGTQGVTAHRSARAILDSANKQALGTSFAMSFTSTVQVDLSRVSGLPEPEVVRALLHP